MLVGSAAVGALEDFCRHVVHVDEGSLAADAARRALARCVRRVASVLLAIGNDASSTTRHLASHVIICKHLLRYKLDGSQLLLCLALELFVAALAPIVLHE